MEKTGFKYTKEMVSQAFQILNTTTDQNQRNECNKYLTEFQVFFLKI